MAELAYSEATPGDVALFFLLAGISAGDYVRVTGYAVDAGESTSRHGVVRSLNAIPKPILCMARVLGPLLEIVTEPIDTPDALQARGRFLEMALQEIPGLSKDQSRGGGAVLLKSQHEEMAVDASLLRRFYSDYDVPHTSSQTQGSEAPGAGAVVIRVHAAGEVRLLDPNDHSDQERE